MIDTDKYEGHLADALICVREGGVECDFSKIRIEDALDDMADLLAEVKRLREDIEGYKAIWDYLDPKGYAWEEEAFVALLKEHGFETGEEE